MGTVIRRRVRAAARREPPSSMAPAAPMIRCAVRSVAALPRRSVQVEYVAARLGQRCSAMARARFPALLLDALVAVAVLQA